MALPSRAGGAVRLALAGAVVAAALALVPVDELRALLDPEALRARAAADGGGVIGVFVGATAAFAFLTGQLALPVIGGAAIFGAVLGPALAVLGVALGSVGQFVLVRYALRGPAERFLAARMPRLADALATRGLGLLVFLRFVWFPAGLTTAGAGISPLSFPRFLVGFPAMLPQAIVVGFATDSLVTYGLRGVPPLRWAAFAGMVGAGIGAYVLAVRRWPQLRAMARRAPDAGA